MTENKAELPTLPVLHSKRLANPIQFPFAVYSHTHDLLAIVTSSWEVSVVRITSGQSAFLVKRKEPEVEITAVSWKQDGTCLGVGWSDGTYGIYDGGTGKQLFMTPLSADRSPTDVADWKLDLLPYFPGDEEGDGNGIAKAGVLGWMAHKVVVGNTREKGAGLTTEEWYDGVEDDDEIFTKNGTDAGATLTDLPRAIMSLDVTNILPRLSAIPTHNLPLARGGGKNTKFATQLSTDSVFATQEGAKGDLIQSLLVCQDSGTVQVLLDETVHIGSCRVRGKPLMHAADAQSSSHTLLTEAEDGTRCLNFIDLPLQTLGGPLLHVIAANTKRVQTFLEYIVQTVRCIEHDYTTEVATPSRFLSSLQGDLDKKEDGGDCVSALFHLAMTGTFRDELLEWLTDVIKDKNYSRWEQALAGMYTNLQNHIFINLLPALDRFSIAVTTLRGLATFHEGSNKFDCPPHLFSNILDKVDSLRLTAHQMQLTIQNEHRQCRAFLKWLRMQLEIGLAGPFSPSALETEEREMPSMDFALILPYINGSMMASKLDLHIKERPSMQGETTKENFFDHDIIRSMSYSRTQKAISEFEPLKPDQGLSREEVKDPIALINLPAITCALIGHVRIVLDQITQWQSRMLPSPTSIPLAIDPGVEIPDLLLTPDRTTRLLILDPSRPNQISILECNPTATHHHTIHSSSTPDLQPFAAQWIPHTDKSVLTLSTHANGDTSVVRHEFAAEGTATSAVLHTFLAGISFKPSRILVGGRRGKLVCVVFGGQGREWRVLDLDGAKGISMADVAEVLENAAEEEDDDDEEEMEEL